MVAADAERVHNPPKIKLLDLARQQYVHSSKAKLATLNDVGVAW